MPDNQNFTSTSQKFLEIHDIIDDVLILKNGSTAVILTVNAMNFGLLAEEEQDAVIYAYAGLLNSINYPVQIVIRSDTKDASSYLKILEERKEKADSKVKREWIERYSQFVSNLIKERNVLDKKFYVIIPASNLEMGLTPAQNLVSGFKDTEIKNIDTNIILEKARNLLEPKRDHLIAQFNRLGLYARQLKTQEIIRLFYTSYNPGASEGQKITKSQSYTTPLVQARIRGNPMVNATPNPAPSNGQTANDQAATQSNQQAPAPTNNQSPATQPATTGQAAQNTQPVQTTRAEQTAAQTQSVQAQPTQPQAAPQQNAPQQNAPQQPVAPKQATLQESPSLQQPPAAEKVAAEKPITPATTTPASTPTSAEPTPAEPVSKPNVEPKPPVQQEADTASKSPKAQPTQTQPKPVQNQAPTGDSTGGSANSPTDDTIKITSPEQKQASGDSAQTQLPTSQATQPEAVAQAETANQGPSSDPDVAQDNINSSLQDLNSKG